MVNTTKKRNRSDSRERLGAFHESVDSVKRRYNDAEKRREKRLLREEIVEREIVERERESER